MIRCRLAWIAPAVVVVSLVAAGAAAQQADGWPDPIANHVLPYQTSGLTHGPMLGRPGATSMRVWVRTRKPTAFRIVYDTKLPLDAKSPGVEGRTDAAHDNTGTVDLTGLKPATRYYYGVMIDGRLADTRMGFDRPWPFFRTLPDATSYVDAKHNPTGRFNVGFSIGCGGSQDPVLSGGQYASAASFASLHKRHGDEVMFHFMNGDYTYEELRDGTVAGVRANYKLYMQRGRSMTALQRFTPFLFMYDDHEVEDNLFGAGEVGLVAGPKKNKFLERDVQLGVWNEYAEWANYAAPQRGRLRVGAAAVEKGGDVLHDPAADFSDLKGGAVSTILVRRTSPKNAGVYGLAAVVDKHRLRVTPKFRADEKISYTIGTHHYYDWKVGNCHFFALDTRGERSRYTVAKRREAGQWLLGEAQRRWLIEGVRKSDAQFIFLISSVGMVVPHSAYHVDPKRGTVSKGDGFPGFVHERELILPVLDKLDKPVLVFTGDVHNSLAVQITDNVWEFMVGPMNSTAHPIGTAGNAPFGGWHENEGRKFKVKWVAGFPNNVHYSRLRSTFYAVVQVNNIFRTAKPEGAGYQYVAYDAPQVIVRYHDGYTGKLAYAEAISTADLKKPKPAAGEGGD